MPADQNGDLMWNRGTLTPPKSVAGIVDDANNGHLLGNVQCEGYVCLHSVAQASGLMAERGVRDERGEAKIDHLVKDWLRLLLIFNH